MSHMQARPGGVREHVENVIGTFGRVFANPVYLFLAPVFADARFDFGKIVFLHICVLTGHLITQGQKYEINVAR
ncbi:hypothetical protein PORCAN_2092 [Porphyromonas crevioricanis JCM 13913]|nr:hypothetical protein PORCAN_2092 [Porphyromonas crevioricanis JCM 13913]